MARKRLILLTMGGTIATTPAADVVSLNAGHLLAAVPELQDIADIEGRDVLSKPSCALTLDDLGTLGVAVEKALESADGIVITHGTDVMEETAYFLALVLKTEKPVVITGAMRRATVPGADGPANIIDACRVAASPESRGQGVLLVMNNEIHAATLVAKTNSFLPNAFTSLGPLGWIAEDRVRFFLTPKQQLPHLQLGERRTVVPLIEASIPFETAIVDLIRGCDGVVFSLSGVGHMAGESVAPAAALAERMPVIFVTRAGHGETFRSTYAWAGGETALIRQGLIPAGYLSARQARMHLLLLLSTGQSLDVIRHHFNAFST